MNRLGNLISVAPAVDPIAQVAGSPTAIAFDTKLPSGLNAFYDDGMVVILVGATSGSPTSFTVDAKLQHSSDGGSTWSDAKDVDGNTYQMATMTAEGVAKIPFDRETLKESLQVLITAAFVGGTTPKVGVGAALLLGFPKYAPAL